MFRNLSLPLQLVAVIAFVLLFGHFVPEAIAQLCYTFSLFFKEILTFLLPFIIFAFVLTGILSFKKNAPIALTILMLAVFLSNAFVGMISYGVALLVLPVVASCMSLDALTQEKVLTPFYSFELPVWAKAVIPGPEKVLLLAVVMGIFLTFFPVPSIERGTKHMKMLLEKFFNSIFIPLLPLYILGFLLKIHYEGVFSSLLQHYSSTFFLIVAVQICCLVWLYLLACGFDRNKTIVAIQNALPSYLTAFSTMSSTATVPVSIKSAYDNTKNQPLSEMAMPIMANVHLLGDSVGTPILSLVTMLLFLGYLPDIVTYLKFLAFFCVSMFAASGIPGGGFLVMIPVLKSQLGFTPEMISIMFTLYVLMDSFGTAANVMGDGALVMILNKILKRFKVH